MAVTLEWVRDHYDNNPKNRRIDFDEAIQSAKDFSNNLIDKEQLDAVQDAYNAQTLLPEYGFNTLSTGVVSTFNIQNGATLEVDGVEVI